MAKSVEHDLTWTVSKRTDGNSDTVYSTHYIGYVCDSASSNEDEKVMKRIEHDIKLPATHDRDAVEAAIIADIEARTGI